MGVLDDEADGYDAAGRHHLGAALNEIDERVEHYFGEELHAIA